MDLGRHSGETVAMGIKDKMTTTHLRLRVPRYDFDLAIELLPDMAPDTADALQAALPVVGLVTTEKTYGTAVSLRLPDYPRPLSPENATVFPIPGDVFIYEQAHGVELVVFFERTIMPYDACGDKPGNRVGVVAATPALREKVKKFWSEGAAWGAASQSDSAVMLSVQDDRAAAVAEIEARRLIWQRQTWRDHSGPPPGTGRQILLTIMEYNVNTRVQLATELSPDTCENIWNQLPISIALLHGRASGAEMFTDSSEIGRHWRWTAKPENLIAYPIPGDMVIYFGYPLSKRLQVNYFYGRDSIPAGIPSPEIGNLIGRSVDDFGAFAEACWRVGYEGWKTLVIDKAQS